MRDLGTLGGAYTAGSSAVDINERGQIVGSSYSATISYGQLGAGEHAFLWQNGRMRDLGTLGRTPPTSDAVAINDRGEIIGNSPSTGDWRAFLWRNGKMTNLGTLGGGHSEAVAISNEGQVIGDSVPARPARHVARLRLAERHDDRPRHARRLRERPDRDQRARPDRRLVEHGERQGPCRPLDADARSLTLRDGVRSGNRLTSNPPSRPRPVQRVRRRAHLPAHGRPLGEGGICCARTEFSARRCVVATPDPPSRRDPSSRRTCDRRDRPELGRQEQRARRGPKGDTGPQGLPGREQGTAQSGAIRTAASGAAARGERAR